MKRIVPFLLTIFVIPFLSYSQTTSQSQSLLISADIQTSPPIITLKWPGDNTCDGFDIYRKSKDATTWGTSPVKHLNSTDSFWKDSAVSIGQYYEYRIYKLVGVNLSGLGYILTGIELPEVENRGKMIFLVDNAYVNKLASEIQRLEFDLRGDGWQIIRKNIDRTMTVANVKSVIRNIYAKDASVNALFLLGHIPVPYSGLFNIQHPPDSHTINQGNHTGAWPADCFYGELTNEGIWTDLGLDTTPARAANWNMPGDGKYDQFKIPSDVELMTGRVDLYNMPAFSIDDTFLMKRYLEKDHNYKVGIIKGLQRGLIDDNLNTMNLVSSGWRGFSAMFGPKNITEEDYFTSMKTGSYLWSCGAGYGSYTSCSGIGTSSNFASDSLQNIFTFFSGSFFGDWDNANNILRAPLASKSTTLVNFWGGIPLWYFHQMALGEHIGFCARQSQNNDQLYYNGNFNGAVRDIHIALMGDPSLRMQYVKPASKMKLRTLQNDSNVRISWTDSPDKIYGYNVYRAGELNGKFIRINSALIEDTFFIHKHPGNGLNVYMVRAVKLETTASGSYYNMSLGIFDSIYAKGVGVNDPEISRELMVFPNPNSGTFNIQLKSNISTPHQLEIFNMVGQKIYEQNIPATTEFNSIINLENSEKGIYLLKLKSSNDVINKKISVQ
jgi:hypothetical protein